MKNLSEFSKRLNYAHWVLLLAVGVLTIVTWAAISIAAEVPQLMFVQSAEDLN